MYSTFKFMSISLSLISACSANPSSTGIPEEKHPQNQQNIHNYSLDHISKSSEYLQDSNSGNTAVSLEQLLDSSTKDGLNMDMVEKRQSELRSKGVSNDVSMKILGVAQQRAMISKLIQEKIQLSHSLETAKKKHRPEIEAQINSVGAQIKLLHENITPMLKFIRATLQLTPEQLANIKGIDLQDQMRNSN